MFAPKVFIAAWEMLFCWAMGWFDVSFSSQAPGTYSPLLMDTATNTNIFTNIANRFCSSQLDHIRSNDGLRFWNSGGQVLPRIRQTGHRTHVNTDELW